MKKDVPTELISFIKARNFFYVIGHEEPDADCLGSQTALGSFLKRNGKMVALCSAGPFFRPEIKDLEPLFFKTIEEAAASMGNPALQDSAVIVVDCATVSRIGSALAKGIDNMPIAVIDHHAAGDSFGDVVFIDTEAPSTSILVYKLIRKMGGSPTPQEAEELLFGFLTDTGYFRHIEPYAVDSLVIVAELARQSPPLSVMYHRMYGGRGLASKQLLGTILSRARAFCGGKVIFIYETLEEKTKFGSHNRDSDTLYSQLQTVEGCEVVAFIREEDEKKCSVGLRSLGFDVGSVAKKFGGGGHMKAAGFTIEISRKKLTELLEKTFTEIFERDF